ncbi:MAG: twin-arginine translocase TatA/TatE family subunit [Chloroflexi bacterium]|nr:twin-arginine translocase TatA/TatE family subunit [Chloroflexota bacterium]
MNTGFLGIGSGELILILVIAVLVVGPEKMVELATKLGTWVAKFRNMSSGATQEFRDAMGVDDVKQAYDEVVNEVKDIDQELKGAVQDITSLSNEAVQGVNSLGNEAAAVSRELQTITSGKTIESAVQKQVNKTVKEITQPKPTGRIPQAVISAVGLPPAATDSTGTADVEPGKADGSDSNDDVNAAPVELQSTTLIEKDEDIEPVEIEDVQVRGQDQESKESSS